MTLRELTEMAEGKADSLWTHTSALMAQVESLATSKSIPIDKYHPKTRYPIEDDGEGEKVTRDEFKNLFVTNPRRGR